MKLTAIKARDGIEIPCGVWQGTGDAILYMHGVESHMGWFKDMAEKLQERGFSVYAFDRRGSGLSKEERGHIDSYKVLLSDIYDVVNKVRKDCPGKRLFLMGVCGGGRFAADFVSYAPSSVDGLILISPAIKMKISLPLMSKVDVLINSFINPKKKIDTPLRDDMFTRNEKYIKFIKNDTLNLHQLTARFYRELVLMDMALARNIFGVDIPILVLLAEDDEIIDNKAMVKWHDRLKASDKTLKQFPGTCHFLPFQENVGEIIEYIAAWIKMRRSVDEN